MKLIDTLVATAFLPEFSQNKQQEAHQLTRKYNKIIIKDARFSEGIETFVNAMASFGTETRELMLVDVDLVAEKGSEPLFIKAIKSLPKLEKITLSCIRLKGSRNEISEHSFKPPFLRKIIMNECCTDVSKRFLQIIFTLNRNFVGSLLH